MASEEALKQLFQAAKVSRQFAGMSDKNIWEACLSHSHQSDDEIHSAIENIRAKDQELHEEAEEQKEKIVQSKEKMAHLREEEAADHKAEEKNAESVLEELFK